MMACCVESVSCLMPGPVSSCMGNWPQDELSLLSSVGW